MKIVVTGGAGFIGSRLVKRLAEMGHQVASWDLRELPLAGSACSEVLDVRSLAEVEDRLAGVEAVYHLAGPLVESSRRNPYEAFMLQHAGTVTVLEACRRQHVPKVLLASSFYVYDGIDERMIVDEETTLDIFRMELFGATKLMAERLLIAYATKYDMAYVILRFGSAYGYGDCSNVVKNFLEFGFRGEPVEVWGHGARRNQYTYVDDLVEGSVLALGERNEVYNLIAPEEVCTAELVHLLHDMYAFDAVFNEAQAEGPSLPYMSSMKALKRLDWSPLPMREGVKGMIKEMRSGSGAA